MKDRVRFSMSEIEIVHKNDFFVVIHKPHGMSFHQEGDVPGVTQRLRLLLPKGNLFPVHRLDRVTSGLMVFGRERKTAIELATVIRKRCFEKYYLALSKQKPKKKQGLILGDMTRSRRGGWKLLPSRKNPTVTQFLSKSIGQNLRLFLLKPLTGRTHQLRVAMKSLGAPVLGDPVYNSRRRAFEETDRTYLHAFALRFELGGVVYTFEELPHEGRLFLTQELRECVESYKRPWELRWPRPPQLRIL